DWITIIGMETSIQSCFKDKTVFLTGATGFVGKAVIEKLLRTTNVKRIYVLIRVKRGVPIQERIRKWSQDMVFERLLQTDSAAMQRISPIAGDCSAPDLGISEADRSVLASQVQLVIHGAATVRFDEPLQVALAINTRATRLMLQLAKEMLQLEAYLHISTAFSNCIRPHIEERFYPEHLSCTSDNVLALTEILSGKVLDDISSGLLGTFPNTYTYTKALAEDVVRREAGDLPVSIFRPSIIIASDKEPASGWIDNLYGPMAILYGVAKGVLRVAILDKSAHPSIVPVDYCANMALACVWKTAEDRKARRQEKEPLIYHLAHDKNNKLSYGKFVEYSLDGRDQCPITKLIWYPFLITLTYPWLYPLAAFFFHKLPGCFFDIALRLSGRKPRLMKIYKRVDRTMRVLGPFSCRSWEFEMRNTHRLQELMSAEDRSLYSFDMGSLDWRKYFKSALMGMRYYLGKEPPTPESLAQGRKIITRLKILHYSLVILLCCAVSFFLSYLVHLIM
ncbi:hypothetical protein KR018_007385, partial [Drosophila ironensis]